MLYEYESDVTSKPEYLTIEIYKNIVQNALCIKFPEILKIKCSMGSACGENYCSQIYRVKILYKSENSNIDSLSVIIKSMPPSDATDFLVPLKTFFKEKTIFYDVLPRLENLMPEKLKFGSRIYHSMTEPINTLVFEDLAVSGFQMASRETGLDEIHSRLVLKRLAQLHASSMVLSEKCPSIKNDFSTGMLAPQGVADDNGMLMRFFNGCTKQLMMLVEKWPGYESIVQKLRKYAANIRENLIISQAPSSKDTFKVLNHGDLWVNNALFKYNDKQPLDVLFVDFQMSIWGSPGIDLNYFFYTSIQLDLLKHKCMILLEHYHTELCIALKSLNRPDLMPSLENVKMEFKNRAAHGFFANMCIFPTISGDKEISKDNNLENFMDEDFAQKKLEAMFRSKRLEDTLKYTLKEFDKLNIWD